MKASLNILELGFVILQVHRIVLGILVGNSVKDFANSAERSILSVLRTCDVVHDLVAIHRSHGTW